MRMISFVIGFPLSVHVNHRVNRKRCDPAYSVPALLSRFLVDSTLSASYFGFRGESP
jgi:hypothetical protein